MLQSHVDFGRVGTARDDLFAAVLAALVTPYYATAILAIATRISQPCPILEKIYKNSPRKRLTPTGTRWMPIAEWRREFEMEKASARRQRTEACDA
jgi:hypothetical protein